MLLLFLFCLGMYFLGLCYFSNSKGLPNLRIFAFFFMKFGVLDALLYVGTSSILLYQSFFLFLFFARIFSLEGN